MKKKFTDIDAAVLAGGKNLRMAGYNKALIRIKGAPIIQRVIEILKDIFDRIILVTNSPEDFKLYSSEVVIVEDIIKDVGPLGGIHSGLSSTANEAVFFAACDMPFLDANTIRREISCFKEMDCDCLVPRRGALIEPLHSVYKKKLTDVLYNFLMNNSGRSIKNFLKTVDTHYMDLDNSFFCRNGFVNINTPADLKKVDTL